MEREVSNLPLTEALIEWASTRMAFGDMQPVIHKYCGKCGDYTWFWDDGEKTPALLEWERKHEHPEPPSMDPSMEEG